MKVLFIVLLITLTTWCISQVGSFKVCGDNTPKADVDKSIKQVVERLMACRSPSWGWNNWSTAITLQVAAPQMFFSRQKSVNAFMRLIRTGWDELSFFSKCEAAFVAKAFCLNPYRLLGRRRSLLNAINEGLGQYIKNATAGNVDSLIDFNFGLGALCINDYSIDRALVDKLLEMQNPDGSFGTGPDSYHVTVWLLRPIFCLSRMRYPYFNVAGVRESVRKVRDYVIRSLNNGTGQLRFGQFDFSSHDALVGLWKSKPNNENVSKWYCNEVMQNLRVAPGDDDDEIDLNRRLLTLTGTDYLDLQSDDYKCIPYNELDKSPPGYQPTCNYEIPGSCGLQKKNE